MFLEEVLGNKTKVKILRVLFEKSTAFTRGELEKETGCSTGAVHNSLKDLKRARIVTELKGKGKRRFYKIKKGGGNPIVKPLSNLFELEAFSERKESVTAHRWNLLAEVTHNLRRTLKDELASIILFGSVARGDAIPSSDVDLLVVLEKNLKNNEEKIRSILKKQKGTSFSLIIHSTKQLEKMKKGKTDFFEELQRDGIVLYRKENVSKVIS